MKICFLISQTPYIYSCALKHFERFRFWRSFSSPLISPRVLQKITMKLTYRTEQKLSHKAKGFINLELRITLGIKNIPGSLILPLNIVF